MKTLLAAIAHFGALANDVNNPAALEEAAKIVTQEAKDSLGTYQEASGPVPAWDPLAASTVEERTRKGFTPDDPLLRSGDLRDSYDYEIDGSHAYVGSNHDAAAYTEHGTATQPARPVLAGAAYRKGEEIANLIGSDIASKIGG